MELAQETEKKAGKLRLPCVFSNGAMFQAGSKLTVNGIAAPGERVRGEIRRGREIISAGSAMAGADGRFAMNLATPGPSFTEHTLVIETAYDCRRVENVLFGEMWIATGQSNMELELQNAKDGAKYLSKLDAGTPVRYYYTPKVATAEEAEAEFQVTFLSAVCEDSALTLLTKELGEDMEFWTMEYGRVYYRVMKEHRDSILLLDVPSVP